MKKILISIMLIFLFALSASAEYKPSISFYNHSNKDIMYSLYWIDHEFSGFTYPLIVATAKLKSRKSHMVYQPEGWFYVTWQELKTEEILYTSDRFNHEFDELFIYTNGRIIEEDIE
ncbi:hypothetical protein LCGC14_1046280 [marine sediment metagenome]|uniref:Uncharacterized protein n=1 Tax=marine sediment metagenome TaxID=412755 RepID=A0A0F9QWB6_9ZZZZ